jgi:hypothetical protein
MLIESFGRFKIRKFLEGLRLDSVIIAVEITVIRHGNRILSARPLKNSGDFCCHSRMSAAPERS